MAIQRPDFIKRPFASNGDKAIIPDEPGATGRASMADGFPVETQTPVAAGGVPPSRLDFNGAFNQGGSIYDFWAQSGGMFPWNATLDYALPCIVFGSDNLPYQAKQESGPGTGAGPKDPADPNNSSYWEQVGSSAQLDPHYLCEIYYFRLPVLRPGFQPAQGGLLENAATLYPDAWAYLQSTEGQMLCKTEAEWQAMTKATWATLADGTKVGWNGIGGAPFYAPDWNTGALRLPDVRGMYVEAAGFDSLGVGGVHGDAVRDMFGGHRSTSFNGISYGMFTSELLTQSPDSTGSTGEHGHYIFSFDASRVVPTANKNQVRSFGALACVYLGIPK